jgi:Cof subfamily protein (haloacid dehalogenase superfamily)
VTLKRRGVKDTMPLSPSVRLLLADVDGTLITKNKVLTDRAVAAVAKLNKAGVLFALTSGRPPRGMAMFVESLDITTPIAAFEGALLVNPDMTIIERRTVPSDLVTPIFDQMASFSLDVWLYRGSDWLIPNPKGPHVDQESATVKFGPTVGSNLRLVTDGIVKMVGVSDDYGLVEKAAAAVRDRFGDHVSAARSQPYYVDVTHPDANKGMVARYLSARYSIRPEQVATIGDMPNDILMFAHSGLSIAMGNADMQVQRAARRITASNDDEGFAKAVERFILHEPPD